MSRNLKKNELKQNKISVCRFVGRSVGLLVPSVTFEENELFTLNLEHRWVSIRKRFRLFLSQIGSGEEDEMGD